MFNSSKDILIKLDKTTSCNTQYSILVEQRTISTQQLFALARTLSHIRFFTRGLQQFASHCDWLIFLFGSSLISQGNHYTSQLTQAM